MREFALLVGALGEDAEHRAAWRELLDGAVRRESAAAGCARRWRTSMRPRRDVDARVAERHEPAARHVAAQQAVDAGADGRRQRRRPARRRGPPPAGSTSAAPPARPCRRRRRSTRRSRRAERQRVEAVAADAVGRLPRRGELERRHLRHRRRQQAALNQARLLELALLLRVAPLRRAAPRRSRAAGFRGASRLPTASARSSCAPRRIASTAVSMLPQPVMTTIGSDGVVRAHVRNQLEPFPPRGRVAGIVQIHQQQVERTRRAAARARRRSS